MKAIMLHCDVQMRSTQVLNKAAVRVTSGKIISNTLFLFDSIKMNKDRLVGKYHKNISKPELYDYSFEADFIKLPLINRTIPIKNRVIAKKWNGDKEDENAEGYAYITTSGKVYHATINCTYLKRSTKGVHIDEVDGLRNEGNGKYYPCEICAKQKLGSEIVYITGYGTSYHRLSNCSTLIRDIRRVPLSEVGSRGKCSKCYQ